MKPVKIIGGLIFLILAAFVVIAIYVFTNLNSIVKEVVESVGSDLTKTEVSLAAVDIDLKAGRGHLRDFAVGNPDGFQTDAVFNFTNAILQIEPRSVTQAVKVIKDITFEGVTVTAEQKGMTTNIQTILKNLKAAGGSTREQSSEPQSEIRLMLEHLKFADGAINLVTEQGNYQLALPKIEVNNIGDKEHGLSPQELGIKILEPLLKQAERSVKDRVETLAKEKIEGELKDKAKTKLKEKLGDDAEEKVKDLKKLFGK